MIYYIYLPYCILRPISRIVIFLVKFMYPIFHLLIQTSEDREYSSIDPNESQRTRTHDLMPHLKFNIETKDVYPSSIFRNLDGGGRVWLASFALEVVHPRTV